MSKPPNALRSINKRVFNPLITLRLRGQMHNVITPEIVDTQAVLPELSPEARWFMTRLGIADFVRLVEVKR